MKIIILAVLGITIVFMGRAQISSEEEIANLTGANIPEMESGQNINQVIIQQIGDNSKQPRPEDVALIFRFP